MYKVITQILPLYNGRRVQFTHREDTNDYNTILSVVIDDEYKSKQMTYEKGDTFVDIGAHIGAWSTLMKHLVPNAKIIAIEPLPENISFIRRNCNAVIIQKAISSRSGIKKKIHYGNETEGGKHHKFVGNDTNAVNPDWYGEEFVEVETINLNDLLKDIERVRVMKMDCEGGEYTSLRFASNETLEKIDYIIGEFHNPKKEEKKTRSALLDMTRGIFNDISESQENTELGQFWFRNKRIE